VDKYGNVSIGFQPSNFASSDLFRIANKEALDSSFWKDYVQVQGPWYARKAAD